MMKCRSNLFGILGLSFQLAKTNFKLKNEGSFIGIFWYLLEPLLLFLIIFGLKGIITGGAQQNYPVYLLLGLIMFNFFSITTSTSTGIINSSSFIKSMKIHHESFVVSRIMEGVFSHFFEIIILIIFMIYYNNPLIWILTYPIIFGFFILFTAGVSFILATLGVYIIDMNNAWRVITRLLFFVTPLFYTIEKGTLLYKVSLFNPLFHFITIARELIINNTIPEYWVIGITIGISLITFSAGIFIFNRYKDKFAEMI